MMIFAQPVTEAHQWWKDGDDTATEPYVAPDQPPTNIHTVCGSPWANHGLRVGIVVCPGDWIVVEGATFRVVHPSIFGTEGDVSSADAFESFADCRDPEHPREQYANYDDAHSVAVQHAFETGYAVDCYGVTAS